MLFGVEFCRSCFPSVYLRVTSGVSVGFLAESFGGECQRTEH